MVEGFSDSFKSVLLIGHNPGIHVLARTFGQDGDPRDVDSVAMTYSPCTLSVIDSMAESWALSAPENSKLSLVLPPQNLQN